MTDREKMNLKGRVRGVPLKTLFDPEESQPSSWVYRSDPAGRIVECVVNMGPQTWGTAQEIGRAEFEYDDRGRLVTRQVELLGVQASATAYTYNEHGDLATASREEGLVPVRFDYEYDHVGNWVRSRQFVNDWSLEQVREITCYGIAPEGNAPWI